MLEKELLDQMREVAKQIDAVNKQNALDREIEQRSKEKKFALRGR